jgi:hypothetical protein
MKKVFNMKVSKAEQVYLKKLQNRPHDTSSFIESTGLL